MENLSTVTYRRLRKKLELTGEDQPIFRKQPQFDLTVWKTCLRLLIELQSRNMLKLLYQWMEFPNFFHTKLLDFLREG
jgi:hypothetical protein